MVHIPVVDGIQPVVLMVRCGGGRSSRRSRGRGRRRLRLYVEEGGGCGGGLGLNSRHRLGLGLNPGLHRLGGRDRLGRGGRFGPRRRLLGADRRGAGLDAELAKPQALIGAELHEGAAHEHEPFAARMLEQVGAELICDGGLNARVARAILGREVDDVVGGRIGARERDALAQLHLTREFARDLGGSDLRAEHAADRAFHQAAERLLEVAQERHPPNGNGAGPVGAPPAMQGLRHGRGAGSILLAQHCPCAHHHKPRDEAGDPQTKVRIGDSCSGHRAPNGACP